MFPFPQLQDSVVTLGSNIISELFVFLVILPVPVMDLKAECEMRSADKSSICCSGSRYCSHVSFCKVYEQQLAAILLLIFEFGCCFKCFTSLL